MADIREDAFRYAIKNAFLHDGKADAGAVVGKIIALHKEIDLKKVMPQIHQAVSEVNSMSYSEIEAEYNKFEKTGYELKPREKAPGLPALEWAESGKEKVVTRYAPNPSGAMHLGHSRAAIVNSEYARMYNGRFFLRFDDTDPKVKKPVPNADKMFLEDLDWLGCKVDEVFFASDRFDIYYKYMKKLIEMEKAYVCSCDNEKWKKKKAKGEACACRGLKKSENLKRFEKMLKHEFKEGEAVLRIKTDIKHKDPSVRDWWAAKIVDKPVHPNPKVKDKWVWPSYNFASAIDDHELGTTLIIRGQEHAQNSVKQQFLFDYLGWKFPHAIHTGRVKMPGLELSKSKINALMKQKDFIGFDDPRLGTIRAFRRRGFDARAIRDVIMEIGVKTNDTTIEQSKLIDYNKKYIDSEADRIVFIEDPIVLDVQYAREIEARLPVHPDFADRGTKDYKLSAGMQRFLVAKKEISAIKEGETIRLKKAYDVKIKEKTEFAVTAEFVNVSSTDGDNRKIVHWVLEEASIPCEILMPDSSKKFGLAEAALGEYETGSHLQFEKFGYLRLDSKGGKGINCWLTHE